MEKSRGVMSNGHLPMCDLSPKILLAGDLIVLAGGFKKHQTGIKSKLPRNQIEHSDRRELRLGKERVEPPNVS
jgi:hypothetical protein